MIHNIIIILCVVQYFTYVLGFNFNIIFSKLFYLKKGGNIDVRGSAKPKTTNDWIVLLDVTSQAKNFNIEEKNESDIIMKYLWYK